MDEKHVGLYQVNPANPGNPGPKGCEKIVKSKAINKTAIIGEFKTHAKDTGSSEVQAAILSKRIDHLIEHLKMHKKDHHTQRGLLVLVGKRKRHMQYLQDTNLEKYREVSKKLGLKEKA